MDPIHEFRNAMFTAGLTPPEHIEPGKMHRFGTNGQRGDDAGWCKLFSDLAGGVFGDFRTGLDDVWQAKRDQPFSAAERADFRQRCEAERRKREAEEARSHAEAAEYATEILAVADGDPATHPYAVKKTVPLGTQVRRGAWPQRGWTDALLLPVFGIDGKIWTLEAIDPEGNKDYLKGGRKRGGFYPFGMLRGASRILIGEGMATVAAGVASWPTVAAAAALDRGNLAAVGQAVRGMAPDAELVFLADNDVSPDGRNPGVEDAMKAAALVGGRVAVPELDGCKCDFWDLWRERGPDAVSEALTRANKPPTANEALRTNSGPIPLESDPMEGLPPFPVEALPPTLREAVEEIARFDKVPVESPASIALSMLATAIGKRASIEERPGLEHHPAVFFALVAPSGERKTPPFKKLQVPLVQHIEDGKLTHERRKAETEAENAVIQARIKRLTKDAEKAAEETERRDLARQIVELHQALQPPPCDPRRFTSDSTEQVLFRLMESHGGEYSIQSSEGRPVFDAILGKYSGEGRTGDAMILAGISGDTITRDRIGNAETGPEHGVIVNPCLNVCVMIQPDKYLQAARHPNLRASGALARIFPVWLPSLVGSRLEEPDEAGLQASLLSAYYRMVKVLLSQPERSEPHRARLSPEAAEQRRLFHNEIERMMAEGGDYADVRDISSKATSQTVKLALVLHVAENPAVLDHAESEVSFETWQRAAVLGRYFLTQAVASQRYADEDATLEPARRILAWMKREATAKGKILFSFAELLQCSPRPRPKARELEAILVVLVDRGHVIEIATQCKRPDYGLWGDGHG